MPWARARPAFNSTIVLSRSRGKSSRSTVKLALKAHTPAADTRAVGDAADALAHCQLTGRAVADGHTHVHVGRCRQPHREVVMLWRVAGSLALLLQMGVSALSVAGRQPVDPASWFACRPGGGPCNPTPKWPPTYLMNASTSLMTLNSDGTLDDHASVLRNWGIIDIDWSNDKSGPNGWARQRPMDSSERSFRQVTALKAASPNAHTKYMVYRNMIKALPWLTVVREKLADPDHTYDAW